MTYEPAYYIARHPDLFRCGQFARIEDVRMVNNRLCFHLYYADGFEDDTPIINEDFVGTGGIGLFYDIVSQDEAQANDR